ncbi:hypothetical protein F5Y05DRAFT_406578 [Hypoxylon sp. FL0543]|nr:hypothetical protein F5Y05DRAFT_406578 [Hypoxylon sp. FL0543]
MDPQRRSLPPASSRPWQLAKVALQCTSLACCVIMFGLSASTTWQGGSGVGILTVPIAIAIAVWTIAELVTLFVRRKDAPGRGIHPGAHVGVQLILFLALILAVFYSCELWRSVERSIEPCNEWTRDPKHPNWVTQNTTRTDDGGGLRVSTSSYYCPESYRNTVNDPSYRSAVQAIIAFCALLWAIHFTLFVRACVETQRRNSESPVMMVYPRTAWPAQFEESHPQREQEPIPMKYTHYGQG